MSADQNIKNALIRAPAKKQAQQGTPRETWQRTIKNETKTVVFINTVKAWRETKLVARDRVTWSAR